MASEVQSIVLDDWLGVGGTFTLGFDGTDTGVVTMTAGDTAYDLATTLGAAFDSAYGSGDMSVSVQVASDPIELYVTFGGDYSELDVALLTVDAESGPASLVITEITRGGDHYEDTAEGGILFAGDVEDIHGIGYSDTAEGGILFAGDVEEYHGFNYSDTATGGIRFGGLATHTKTTAFTATGGILFAGAGVDGYGNTYTAEGGIEFGTGITESHGFYDTATGGIRFGGDGVLVLDYNNTATGGFIFGQAIYGNGFKYRMAIIVPAGKVGSDLSKFILPVRADLPVDLGSDSIGFTDDSLNTLPHDLVRYSAATGRVWAYVKCDLAAATDNTIYIYYGE